MNAWPEVHVAFFLICSVGTCGLYDNQNLKKSASIVSFQHTQKAFGANVEPFNISKRNFPSLENTNIFVLILPSFLEEEVEEKEFYVCYS